MRSKERGQSTVEFALVLPALFIVVLAAAQVGLVVVAKFGVMHTAREVARSVSIDPSVDPDAVAAIASPLGEVPRVELRWRASPAPDIRMVEVEVSQRVPAVFGTLLPDIDVSAIVLMTAESDP